MTIRQQIESLIYAGCRNCEIEQQLKCDPAYIFKVRKSTGIANKTAYWQRMPKLIKLVAQGLDDEQIAPYFDISPASVKKMRNAGNVRRIKLHEKHHEVVEMIRLKNKRAYISAVTGVPESTIAAIWKKQQMLDKKPALKQLAPAGSISRLI